MSAIASLRLPHPVRLQVPVSHPFTEGRLIKAHPPALPRVVSHRIALPVPNLEATPINDTLGWDTVFAVPVTEVNKRFAVSGLYPKDYAATVTGALFGTQISGNFGSWSITTGGSGAIVNLLIPIATGTMTITPSGAQFPLAGGQVYVEVKLNYLPQPAQGKAGKPNQLQVSTKAMNPTGNVAQVTQLILPNQTDPTVITAAETAFQAYFNKNLARIAYIFNTVNLNAVADKDAFQWLMPTYTSYAYYDAPTIDKAIFGVLCMVDNNDPGTNTNQIGPGAIPVGAQSGFSLSSQLFLRKMVLPVMANAFNSNNSNATIDSSYFNITNNDTEIVNTKSIPMADVKYGAIYYHPECTDFSVTLQATRLVVYTKIHVNISPGIDAYVEQTSYFTLKLTSDSAGNQYLTYIETSPAVSNHWTDVATGIIVTEIVLAIIGAVVGAVAGIILKGAQAVVAVIVIAIVFGIAAAIPQLIAKVTGDGVIGNVPPINSLVTAATNNVKWTGGTAFQIQFVQLNGSLQMAGNAFV